MSVKVFIDGSSGTTGLRIADRLAARPEIELLSISAEGRKDVNERASVINSADLAFLCLPDAASREVMPLLRPVHDKTVILQLLFHTGISTGIRNLCQCITPSNRTVSENHLYILVTMAGCLIFIFKNIRFSF